MSLTIFCNFSCTADDFTSQEYTKDELERLYRQTSSFCDKKAKECNFSVYNQFTYLYRDGHDEYFKDIKASKAWMQATHKDEGAERPHGDPRSPINRSVEKQRPKGLFFQSNVQFDTETRKFIPMPLGSSVFGNNRIQRTMDAMFGKFPHAYFAEFYCLPGSKKYHVVTIVLANDNDRQPIATNVTGYKTMKIKDWCDQNLIKINVKDPDNKLVYFDDKHKKWFISSEVFVNFFVTGTIRIKGAEIERCKRKPNQEGTRKERQPRQTVQKDPQCDECKLKPEAEAPAVPLLEDAADESFKLDETVEEDPGATLVETEDDEVHALIDNNGGNMRKL